MVLVPSRRPRSGRHGTAEHDFDIETLYEPVKPLPIHGETAVELLEELKAPCVFDK